MVTVVGIALLHAAILATVSRPLALSNTIQLLAPLLAALCCVGNGRDAGTPYLRRLWYQIGTAFALWTAGQVWYLVTIFAGRPNTFPSGADFLWIFFGLPILLATARTPGQTRRDLIRWLDVAQACFSMSTLCILVLLQTADASPVLVYNIQSAALLLTCGLRFAVEVRGPSRILFRDLTIYVFANALCTFIGIFSESHGFPAGTISDLAWSAPFFLFILLAVRPQVREHLRSKGDVFPGGIVPARVHTVSALGLALVSIFSGAALSMQRPMWGLPLLTVSCLLFALRIATREVQLRRAQAQAQEGEERLKFLAESIPHHVWTTYPDGALEYCNPQAQEYFGLAPEQVQRFSLHSLISPEDMYACRAGFEQATADRQEFRTECRMRSGSGLEHWFQIHLLPQIDNEGALVRWFGTSTNVHDRKDTEARLEHAALHDALTGLANRQLLSTRITRALHQRRSANGSAEIALLFIDLDRFKLINDSLGHAFGDRLLMEVAAALQLAVRPGDTVTRFGGDEFVVLLEGVEGQETAHLIADRILDRLQSPFVLEDRSLYISASIGIVLGGEADNADDLLRDADSAMYRAKSQGRNRAQTFDRSMLAQSAQELELETDLRRAIKDNALAVWYQPIYSISDQVIEGFEALARWPHPSHGMVPPSRFIPLAEDTGLIIELGRWVLAEACAQLQEWNRRFGSRLSISVNISPRQFSDPRLLQYIREVLEQTELPPELLKLEITESVMLADPKSAESVLLEAQALGIKICLDDFGIGYSSLSYLLQFPFDTVKIDQSFVRDLDRDHVRTEVVRTVVQLAANLKKTVVAEGIETEGELQQLCRMHCDSAQGFLLSRPLAPTIMTELLRSQSASHTVSQPASLRGEAFHPSHPLQTAASLPPSTLDASALA